MIFDKKSRRCKFDVWLDTLVHEGAAFRSRRPELDYWCDISFKRELDYISYAFENAEEIFAKYSNLEIDDALWHLVGVGTETMHILLVKRVPWHHKERCVNSFIELNKQVFAKRCSLVLCHLGKEGDPNNIKNPLNSICYMWWDIFSVWGGSHLPKLDDLFFDVMVETLKIDHVACQEGVLHGLGHIPERRPQVRKAITDFINDNPNLSPELHDYALAAMSGMIL
jgi:hypothetical protein